MADNEPRGPRSGIFILNSKLEAVVMSGERFKTKHKVELFCYSSPGQKPPKLAGEEEQRSCISQSSILIFDLLLW